MMPGMAVREFACSLCQQPFTMLSGDLMLPGPNICDDCVRAVWDLEDEALMKHVARSLGSQNEDQSLVNNNVQHIKGFKKRWETFDKLIQQREQERGFFN